VSGTTAFLGGTVFAGLLAFLLLKGETPGSAVFSGTKTMPTPTDLPTVTVSQLPQPSTADPLAVYNAEQQKKEAEQLKAQLEKQVSETDQLKAKVESQSKNSDQYKALLEAQTNDANQLKAQLEKQAVDFQQSKTQLEKQQIETEQLKSQLRNQQLIVESLTTQLKANTEDIHKQNAQSIFGNQSPNALGGLAWMLMGIFATIGGSFVLFRMMVMSNQRQPRLINSRRAQRDRLQPKRYGKFLLPSQQLPEVHYEERRVR
jgi:hypothetical protein